MRTCVHVYKKYHHLGAQVPRSGLLPPVDEGGRPLPRPSVVLGSAETLVDGPRAARTHAVDLAAGKPGKGIDFDRLVARPFVETRRLPLLD